MPDSTIVPDDSKPQHDPLGPQPQGAVRFDTEGVTHIPKAVADSSLPVDPNDFLTTGRSKTGSPVAKAALTPDSLVKYKGQEWPISSLVRAGVVTGNEATGFKAVEQSKQAEAPKPSTPTYQTEAFEPEMEKFAGEAAALLSPSSQVACIEDWAKNGSLSDKTVARLVSETGGTPDQARDVLGAITSSFDAQAAKAFESYGDPAAVLGWAKATQREALASARRLHAQERTTAGYREIGKKYKQHADFKANEKGNK